VSETDQTSAAADLMARLSAVGYLADPGLVAAAVLAIHLNKPIFLEGEPGVGKSTFARAMAQVLGAKEPIRLQCHSSIDASQALYDWDFPRQVLTLRAAAEGRPVQVGDLYRSEFLVRRPVLQAFERQPAVLLIDEIDRADDEFEACLLEVLDGGTVTIPELGELSGLTMPLVVLTSNQTREVHEALKRRCLYHWIEHPDRDREIDILRRRVKPLTPPMAAQIADLMVELRKLDGLEKCPGVAEAIDLARAVVGFGITSLHAAADFCAATIAKHRDDVGAVLRVLASIPEPRDPS
jgi:MoxR-like ATPase